MTINSSDQTHPEGFRLLGEMTNSPDQHQFPQSSAQDTLSKRSTLPTFYKTVELDKRDVVRMVNIPSLVSPKPRL